jgi:hypothetical protein
LNDIGSAPSSLNMLSLVRPDVIKLDRSIVQGDTTSWPIAYVINAVFREAERTGSAVLAEAIETAEHLQAAISMGATLGQGFYLGRPGPPPATIEPSTQTMPRIPPPGALQPHGPHRRHRHGIHNRPPTAPGNHIRSVVINDSDPMRAQEVVLAVGRDFADALIAQPRGPAPSGADTLYNAVLTGRTGPSSKPSSHESPPRPARIRPPRS